MFSIEVPNGSQVEVWLGANTITARHTLRWGGACPGDNFVDCLTTETRRFRFVNNTGSNEIAYYTVGNSTAPGTCGTYRVGWELTPCATLDIPVLETFDAVATPVLPSCWGTVQALPLTATTSPTWESYSTTPYSAPNSASILGAATGNDDWLFSPGISLTGGQGYVLDFWWRGASTTVPESLEVMAGIANTSGDMTETVFALDTIKSTVYQQFFGGFTPGADGIYYLGFHNTTKRSAGRTRIDDVQFYEVGGCSAPDVTVNAVVGQDSATLVATTVGGAGGPPEFQWFTGENCVPGNEIVGANTDTYVTHVSGVFSCKAWIIDPDNCADCDSTEATVIDCSAPVALPISEGFESTSGTALPICWSYQNYDGDTRFWTTSSTNPHAGLRAAYIQASVSGTIPNDWLYIPIVALNAADDYLLTFWWREGTVLSTYFDSLEVLLTTGPDNISTVSVIVPIFRAATSTYQETMAIFSPPADGNYYVAFRYTGGDADGGIRVDDISLEVAGNCTAPTVSVADSTAIGTVAMFCSATGGSGGPLQYQWYTGQTCTPGNEIVGANSASYSTTISGDYACKAWRYDPDICSACDWGTATVTPAPPGYDCSNPISLAGEEGNAPYNNCGMGDMSPGQDCGTAGNNSGEDMVFVMTVPAGNQASIWQSVNTFDSRHSLRWGGDCPGTNLVGCVDTPDTLQYVWVNNTGETQNLYFVVGGYNNTTLCGDFTLQWYNYPPCPNVTCTPTFTETGNNSGCGVDSTFNTVSCTDVISGTVFATPTLRDVDAYEVTLTGYTDLTVTVNPEFDAILQVRFGGCSDYLIGYANAGGLCDPETVTVNSIPAGVVHIYVYAPFIETVGDQSYCVTMSCSAGEAPDIVQDFEADNGAWDATPATGGWEWGQPTAPDGPPAAHSGVNVWGTVLAGDYPSNACWTLDLDLGLTVDEPTASLRCWMWYDTETNYDGCQFHVSVDGGANWILVTPEGGYPQSGFTTNACLGTTTDYWGGNSGGWILVSLPLGAFENQVPIFRFWFGSDPSVTYPGVFIDDIELFGVVGTNDGPPQPVTNLQAQVVDHDVTLTWLDPTQDVIGNPIVVDSVQIWLGAVDTGTRLGAVGAGVQTFVHQDAQDGLAIYVLRPYNNGSAGGTTSVNAIVGNPYYVQDFETDGGAWVADGGWEWGQPTDPDGPTAHSGINVWGTVLAGDYANNACYNLTLSPGVAVSSANATVEFWRWYDTEANFDGCNFNVSVDGGTTWEVVTPLNGYPGSTNTSNSCNPSEPAWTDHNGDSWVYDVIPIGQYIGATPQFRFTFGSDISIVYPGFFFDDMTIWGLQSCQPDTVDDLTVYRDVALSNDVHLRWSGDPAMEGTYTVYWNNTMDVFPGSWTVLAGGLAPAADMEYVDVGVVTAAAKRYYLIVSECSAVVAASKPVPIAPGAQK